MNCAWRRFVFTYADTVYSRIPPLTPHRLTTMPLNAHLLTWALRGWFLLTRDLRATYAVAGPCLGISASAPASAYAYAMGCSGGQPPEVR